MRKIAFVITSSLAVSTIAVSAFAQIDPSAALLLNQGNRTSTKDSGLDSGRYTVRPRPQQETQTPAARREDRKRINPNLEEGETGRPSESSAAAIVAPADATQPVVVENPPANGFLSKGVVNEGIAPAAPSQAPTPGQASAPFSQVVMGGSGEELQQYRQAVGPDDRRLNLLEISLAPTFIYNESRSDYSFRNYVTSGPGFHTQARVWVSPFLGAHVSYDATLGGSIQDSSNGSKNVVANQQWLRAGIRGRRYLSANRLASSLIFGADFYEYQMKVAADATSRGGLRTTGVVLALDSEWPTSYRYAWLLGATFMPRARHSEKSTMLDLRSGANVETNAIGVSLGGRFIFDKSSSVFYRVSHTVEKNLFSGTAVTVDPRTGIAPTGVPVLNSFTVFQVGYTWGN